MLRMAFRMVLDDPLKSLGTFIGVVFAVFLMCQQLSILLGIFSRETAFIDKNAADVWVVAPATESIGATSSVPEQRVRQAGGVDGVQWAAPVIISGGEVTKANGVKEKVMIVGVEGPLFGGFPESLMPGTDMAAIATPGRVIMEWRDREYFGFPNVGDRIELNGQMAILGGFTERMQGFDAYYMFTNIHDARAYAGNYPADRVTFVAVKVTPGANPMVVRDRIQARIPDTIVVTREQLHDMTISYFLKRTPVGFIFGIGTVIAALIGTLIVTVTLFSAVVDRTREYGTLKALGATRADLRRLLSTQALIFAATGYTVGMTIFGLLRLGLENSPLTLKTPLWVVGSLAVVTVLLCLGASILAIRRVLKLEPALVFKG